MVTQHSDIPERFLTGRQPPEQDVVEIHRDDAGIVALFFALRTQWHRHAMTGQRMGIDYSQVRPTAELAFIDITPDTLPSLQAMEEAALIAFAEAAK